MVYKYDVIEFSNELFLYVEKVLVWFVVLEFIKSYKLSKVVCFWYEKNIVFL